MAAAALLVAGCGLGAGSQEGSVQLLVTRDYGRQVLVDETKGDLTESETAMRVLDDSVDLETRYGGGFVQAVNGLDGGTLGGRSFDWFYSVNGIVAERGAAELPVGAGDQVWWDYRDWTDAQEVGAVVGAFPAPMSSGYDGDVWPVIIQCAGGDRKPCDLVREQFKAVDIESSIEMGTGDPSGETLRVLVGTWPDLQSDSDAERLGSAPGRSGVFARFEVKDGEGHLIGLDQQADEITDFGADAGLIAASRRKDGPPVWFVTGGSTAGVQAAASGLTESDLQRRYAAVVNNGRIASLPLP